MMNDPASSSLLMFLLASDASAAAEPFSITSAAFGIAAVILLVAANGFFVASEFALVAVRKSRIESLAAGGQKNAQRLLDLLNNLNAYISATQLGITLASLALGWVGEPAIARLVDAPMMRLAELTQWQFLSSPTFLHAVSFTIAFTLITFLHIVLGELAPKTLALERAEAVSLAVAAPLDWFYRIFSYPIRLLDWTGTRVVQLFGLHSHGEHGSIYTEEEIRQLVRQSEQSGHLNAEERTLIDQVFEFSETTVREAMIPRTQIAAVSADSSLKQIAEAFQQNGYSRLPVYRGSLDDAVGFIHSKDVLPYLLYPSRFKLEDVLQSPLYVVDTGRLEDVLRQMQKDKRHFAFVVDEHGGIEGILTLEDLLEEIVGDISDEHDDEVNEQIVELGEESYLLDGGTAVRDINKRLEMQIPESEAYTTLAGFLMSESGQILNAGEIVPFNGHVFRIEEVDKRRILKVKMEKSLN